MRVGLARGFGRVGCTMLWPFFEKFWAAAGPRPFEEPVMKIRDILQSCE